MRVCPACIAVWKSLKMYARNFLASGWGWTLSVTSVMTPSVPSEPRNIIVRSGPDAWRGTGSVRMISPVGVTTSSDITMSSILPYFVERTPVPRCARKPPIVEHAIEAGRCIVERPALLQPHSRCFVMMPVCAVTVSASLSILIILFILFMSRTMPLYTGSAPPCEPDPPPHGTTGILYWFAIFMTRATSCVVAGWTTKSGFGHSLPRSCHISGIQ